jgi:hypothetical protein
MGSISPRAGETGRTGATACKNPNPGANDEECVNIDQIDTDDAVPLFVKDLRKGSTLRTV